MLLNGKTVYLPQLQEELIAAGIAVTSLGTSGDELQTYDAKGVIIDLPKEAAAVLATHVANPPLDADTALKQEVEAAATLEDLKAALIKHFNATKTL